MEVHGPPRQLLGQTGKTFWLSLDGPPLDRDVLAIDPAERAHPVQEALGVGVCGVRAGEAGLRGVGENERDSGRFPRLLRLGHDRRSKEHRTRASEERATVDHWMISSARPSSDGGIVRPRALAVLRLMTSSNLVGCSMGRSAGFAPFRILST